MMKARYAELEKLEGQFDVEVDVPELGDKVEGEEAPVTTSILEDDKE
jgi:hypothetical protein